MAALDILGPASALNSVTVRPPQAVSYGATRTWFKNCTSLTSADGTQLTNDWLNNVLAQARSLFDGAGIVEDNGDDMTLRSVQSLAIRYGADTGTADAMVVTFTPPVTALTAPLTLAVIAANDCDGNAVTINANGLGAVAIVGPDGNAPKAKQIKGGALALLEYNGNTHQFQLLNPYTVTAPGTQSTPKAPKLIGFTAETGSLVLPQATNTLINATVSQNNLWGTSTYNNSTYELTVGSDEAGLWFVTGWMWLPAPGGGQNIAISIRQNGGQVFISEENGGWSGNGAVCNFSFILKCAAGDTLQYFGYQQTGDSIAINSAQISAYLIGAY